MARLIGRRELLIATSGLLLAGCERFGGRANTGAVIGVLCPLTGDQAAYGDATRKGVELAVEEINANGGVGGQPLRVAFEDDRMSATDGVSAFQRLVAAEHPSLVIGPFGSSVVLAVAETANSARVPILSASATADSIAEAGDYVFRITPPNSQQGIDIATFSYNTLNARKAMVVFQNNDYGVTLRDAFVARFTELGGEVATQDGYAEGATDFRASLAKARTQRPGVIFFPLHSQESTLFLRQAREQNLRTNMISADGAMTQELLQGAGPAAEGAYFSTLALGFGVADQQIEAFRTAYAAKYGAGEPDVYSAYYYEATKIAAQVIETTGTEPEAVKRGLYAINAEHPYVGVTGRTAFDANGEVNKSFYIYRAQGGAFVRV